MRADVATARPTRAPLPTPPRRHWAGVRPGSGAGGSARGTGRRQPGGAERGRGGAGGGGHCRRKRQVRRRQQGGGCARRGPVVLLPGVVAPRWTHQQTPRPPCCRAPMNAVDAAVAVAVSAFGGLHIAVANAGIVRAADFLEMSEEDFDAVIRVNLKGVFLVRGVAGCRRARPLACPPCGVLPLAAPRAARTSEQTVTAARSPKTPPTPTRARHPDWPGGRAADGGAGRRRRDRDHGQRERADGHPLHRRLQCRQGGCAQPHALHGARARAAQHPVRAGAEHPCPFGPPASARFGGARPRVLSRCQRPPAHPPPTPPHTAPPGSTRWRLDPS